MLEYQKIFTNKNNIFPAKINDIMDIMGRNILRKRIRFMIKIRVWVRIQKKIKNDRSKFPQTSGEKEPVCYGCGSLKHKFTKYPKKDTLWKEE